MKALVGYHLIVDGQAHRRPNWTVGDLRELLDELVAVTGLTPVSGPHLFRHHSWLIGMTVIAESHISAHLDCEWGQAYVDVFSCREFDYTTVPGLVARRLGLVRYQHQYLERMQDAA